MKLAEIKIGERLRSIDESNIETLMESIKEIGLIQPIVVDFKGNLVAGRHRLEACKRLGWDDIEALPIDIEGLNAELAEIDENLMRSLPWQDEVNFVRRRKEIYEELHPETKQYSSEMMSNVRRGAKTATRRFTEDTAKKVGKSERTIQSDVQIAELVEKNPEYAALPTKSAVLKEEKKKQRAAEIDKQRQAIENGEVKLPEGKFEVIAIDPPWQYAGEYDPEFHRGPPPYPCMTQQELLDMEIPASDDAVLWLWTTPTFIWDAKELMDKWGFTYKGILVWDKEKMGLGVWFRNQCEYCLLGVKGKPMWNGGGVRDILHESRREHSRKPDGFYKMVEEVCVGRKLDYFSREPREGWETFGNDTTKFDKNGD